MTSLVVDLNRGELYAVEPVTGPVEVTGSFSLELRNHGQAVHVHLRLDDDLARVARLNGTNLFVDSEEVVTVPIEVADGAPPTEGSLSVVTGYGKGEEDVAVHIVDPDAGRVSVDERLDRPERAGQVDGDGSDDERGGVAAATDLALERTPLSLLASSTGAVLVGVLILVALAVSGIAILAAPGLAVVLGILAVLVGVGVAGYVMIR